MMAKPFKKGSVVKKTTLSGSQALGRGGDGGRKKKGVRGWWSSLFRPREVQPGFSTKGEGRLKRGEGGGVRWPAQSVCGNGQRNNYWDQREGRRRGEKEQDTTARHWVLIE